MTRPALITEFLADSYMMDFTKQCSDLAYITMWIPGVENGAFVRTLLTEFAISLNPDSFALLFYCSVYLVTDTTFDKALMPVSIRIASTVVKPLASYASVTHAETLRP